MSRKMTDEEPDSKVVDLKRRMGGFETEGWAHASPPERTPPADVLKFLLDQETDGSFICDEHGTPMVFNEAYARAAKDALGIEMKAGIQPIEFLDGPQAVKYWERVRDRTTGRDGFRVEFSYEVAKGDVRTFEFDFSPVVIDGQFKGFIKFSRDITKRKQAEIEKEQQLSQLRATLEATADGIAVVNRQGNIESFNARFKKILGIPASILDSRDAKRVLAYLLGMASEPDNFLQIVSTAVREPQKTTFDTLHLRDGRVLEICSRPQRLGDDIIGRVWALRDVSDRSRSENALREKLGFLETIMNGMSTLVCYVDSRERYIFANTAYAAWFDLTPDKLRGRRMSEIMSPELYQSASGRIKKALSGERVSFANEVAGKDGERRYVEVNYDPHFSGDTVDGAFMAVFDVTAHKRAEKRLHETEERLKFILEKVPVLIWLKDRDGRYLKVNKTFCEVKGLPPEEIVGKTDREIFDPSVADQYGAFDQKVIDSEEPEVGIEEPYYSASKRSGWLRKDKFPYIDATGKVAGTIGIALDISEQKKTQEALQQSEALLRAQSELKAKNKKLQEINTAMNVLLEKMEMDESRFQEKIAANIRHLVFPFLERIERKPLEDDLKLLLKAVRFNLERIDSTFSKDFSSARFGLTSTEIRVADLVRQGQKSKDIAEILKISFKTVESHRENIRKKLGIANKKKNLRTFLLSIR